jgi:hypothetical protein
MNIIIMLNGHINAQNFIKFIDLFDKIDLMEVKNKKVTLAVTLLETKTINCKQ